MGSFDRSDGQRQETADLQREHRDTASSWLPFNTPAERVVSSIALIAIAACSLLFGILGGAVAFAVYALGLKLYERHQRSQTATAPDSE